MKWLWPLALVVAFAATPVAAQSRGPVPMPRTPLPPSVAAAPMMPPTSSDAAPAGRSPDAPPSPEVQARLRTLAFIGQLGMAGGAVAACDVVEADAIAQCAYQVAKEWPEAKGLSPDIISAFHKAASEIFAKAAREAFEQQKSGSAPKTCKEVVSAEMASEIWGLCNRGGGDDAVQLQ